MTLSLHLSDRMPEVALGRRGWTVEEAAHLASCPECGAEWRVVLAGSGVGRRVERELDVEAVVSGVARRLEEERVAPRLTSRPLRWVLLAAAAILLALVLNPGRLGRQDARQPAAQQALLPELEGLAENELEQLLEVIPAARSGVGTGLVPPGLGDLTDQELERVLRTLEG